MPRFSCGRSLAALAFATAGLAATEAAAAPVPITLTVTSVNCTQAEECDAAGIEAAGQSWPDFYARVYIDGLPTDTPRADDDQSKIDPFWVVTRTIDDTGRTTVPVTIQIWDQDDTSGDDLADASPQPDHNNLDLTVDLTNNTWSGDTATSCATGDGVDTDDDDYYPVRVCFDIAVGATTNDADNDGLLDRWERSGLDRDGDGVIDVDLPAMGANPARQDVFLELDYEAGIPPTRDGINAMKAAFAAAPRGNPDGSTGITLHVDSGALIDPTADEAGLAGTCLNGLDDNGDGLIDGNDPNCFYVDASREVGVSNCGNGVDDDGDGRADGADPQCLVGDNLGGGSALAITAATRPCGLDGNFAAIKALQFNPNRHWVFHYAMQAAAPPNPPAPAPPLKCAGGEGEIGGNDFISHNVDAGTVMHELGHNLNLQHGGSNGMNCKPNYISVMNYNSQFGILWSSFGGILDYSPPRRDLAGTVRSNAPLGNLVESALSETTAVDAADGVNWITFMDGRQTQMVSIPANSLPDWTGDPTLPTSAGVNIDNGIPAVPASPGVTPVAGVGAPGCANGLRNSTLAGDNDWNRVALAFRQFGASAEGVLVRNVEDNPTTQDMTRMRADVRKTDLALGMTAAPDPVAAGTPLSFSAVVTNNGPNPAGATVLDIEVPGGAGLFGAPPAGCTVTGPGRLSCALGMILPRQSLPLVAAADVPANLVYDAGAPLPVSATGRAMLRTGTDPQAGNDSVTLSVTAVAVADLSVRELLAPNAPIRMRTGEQVVVELASTLGSAGPSSPMDAALTFTGKATPGATVSPTEDTTRQVAVRNGEDRRVTNHPILFCSREGRHVFDFAQTVGPDREADSDPNTDNDTAVLQLVVECRGRSPSPDPSPQPSNDECTPPNGPNYPGPYSIPGLLDDLGGRGVDYSIQRDEIASYMSVCPPSTSYPAIGQAIVEQNWAFSAPVHMDVIVAYYEATPGVTPPRVAADVSIDALKAAILTASNERNGTQVTRFEDLLR